MLLPSVRLETSTLSSRLRPSNRRKIFVLNDFSQQTYEWRRSAHQPYLSRLGMHYDITLTCFTHARKSGA